jgi:penicillin-binding protein 2
MRQHKENGLGLEDALDLGFGSAEVREIPLHRGSLAFAGLVTTLMVAGIIARVLWLGVAHGAYYTDLANANVNYAITTDAPRGRILDVNGKVLADNVPSFSLQLDVRAYLKESEDERHSALAFVEQQTGADIPMLEEKIAAHVAANRGEALTLFSGLTEQQVVAIRAAKRTEVAVHEGYQREYPYGAATAHVVGYTGTVNADDLKEDSKLIPSDIIGRQGVEQEYDAALRGTLGRTVQARDAKGQSIGDEVASPATPGKDLHLTIDAELQKYAYEKLMERLNQLGRARGAVVIQDPRDGAIRALVSIPSYDPEAFTQSNRSDERRAYLTDPQKPLFNRIVSGEYTPGSTVKPMHAVAIMTEGIVSPDWSIFSPGYLDIPNPYHPEKPTRYLDWRYQGTINVRSAIAQSSDVYFYATTGGTGGLKGLGITKLRQWWQKFLLGEKTGIDLPSERTGFLPSPEWKKKNNGTDWLVGDTFNVSIGQGDLTMTPIQLVDYISGVANGGKLYRPFVRSGSTPEVRADLSQYTEGFKQAELGMRLTVTSDLGTAHPMHTLPFAVAGKTGSAQIENNAKENAFFVGYAPYQNPEISMALLVEDSKEGSLNAVPVAQSIFQWWYENRGAGAPVDKVVP